MVGRLLGFVPNAIPDGLTDRETEVYQRIGRQYRRRKRWYLHVMIFLISMVMIWVSYLLYYPFYASASTAITLTLVWLMILGTHRLWMNLGKSEDREIGEALQHLRQTQQTVYYEETYEERSSRLEDNTTEDNAWDDEYMYQTMKAKRLND